MARPTKLVNWIKAFETVVSDGFNAIYLTDDDLRVLTNDLVEADQQITDRTFERWKAGEIQDELFFEFCRLYKKAIITQKRFLFERLQQEEDKWQKWAWIIERKFKEWNLKHISEIDHTSKGESITKISIVDIDGAEI